MPSGHTYAPSLEEAVNQAWNEHGALELIERANPGDYGRRELERAWHESGHPDDRSAYMTALSRAGLYLPYLRDQWALLAQRKQALRLATLSFRRGLRLGGLIPTWRAALPPELDDDHEAILAVSLPLATFHSRTVAS